MSCANEHTPKFYHHVKNIITNKIILTQSTSVDTIFGVTYSCNGIIDAVENTLSQAK